MTYGVSIVLWMHLLFPIDKTTQHPLLTLEESLKSQILDEISSMMGTGKGKRTKKNKKRKCKKCKSKRRRRS